MPLEIKHNLVLCQLPKKTLFLNLLQTISHLNDSNTLHKNIVLYLCNNPHHPMHTLQNYCHHHRDHPWHNVKFHKLKLLKVNIFFKKIYILTKLEIRFLKVLFHYLCSRNFQNMKLRLNFVKIWSFNLNSDFAWNQILAYSHSSKMSFLAILEGLNLDF